MYQFNFKQVSNCADWIESVELTDEDTGDLIDLTGYTITLQVSWQTPRGQGFVRGNYGPGGYGYNGFADNALVASTTNGKITVPSLGVFTWTFRASDMASLAAGNYEVGVIMANPPSTEQLILGVVPIVNGVVGQ
jgi:hypothetical protein